MAFVKSTDGQVLGLYKRLVFGRLRCKNWDISGQHAAGRGVRVTRDEEMGK